jgi:predicted benzoate:H+ symporter BenE
LEKYGRARQATDDVIRRMRFECWIAKATDALSDNVILTAFQWVHWVLRRATMLRYAYIAYLVYNYARVFEIEEPLRLMQIDENLPIPWMFWLNPRLVSMRCMVNQVPL